MLEDARSALPPIRPGTTLASAFKHCWERFLVASPGLSGVYFYKKKKTIIYHQSLILYITAVVLQVYMYTYRKSISPASRELP